MVNVIGVRFKPASQNVLNTSLDFDIKQGDSVIVETSRIIEYGEVVMSKKTIDNDQFKKPLKGVIRIATEEDTEKAKGTDLKRSLQDMFGENSKSQA